MTLLGLVPWESYLSVPTGASPKPFANRGAHESAVADPGWCRSGHFAGALAAFDRAIARSRSVPLIEAKAVEPPQLE
jgi:hypothetical protein